MDGVGLDLIWKQLAHPLHTPRRPCFCTSSHPFHLPPLAPSSSSSTTSSTPNPYHHFLLLYQPQPQPASPGNLPSLSLPRPPSLPSSPLQHSSAPDPLLSFFHRRQATVHSPTHSACAKDRPDRFLFSDRLLQTLSVICCLSVCLSVPSLGSFLRMGCDQFDRRCLSGLQSVDCGI